MCEAAAEEDGLASEAVLDDVLDDIDSPSGGDIDAAGNPDTTPARRRWTVESAALLEPGVRVAAVGDVSCAGAGGGRRSRRS